MAAVAARMRLGHIPAGSTDAVAYSINGTRSQLTAALHIALGDRSTPSSLTNRLSCESESKACTPSCAMPRAVFRFIAVNAL